MVKNLIQDVVPPERKSIKRIPVPTERPRHLKAVDDDHAHIRATAHAPKKVAHGGRLDIPEDSRPTPPERHYDPSLPYTRENYEPETIKRQDPPRTSSRGLWVTAAASIIVLFLIFSFAFAGVKMTIVPREETAALNGQFTAKKSDPSLPYDVMTLNKMGEKTVPAGGKEHVERKASGTLTIVNNHSTASQKLIKNTRFETPTGLIYRISEDVTVPGQSLLNGKLVAGTIDVTVYADKPGTTYNLQQAAFTIPGFKGDPRYSTITGKTKTAFTGGFSGEMSVVDDATLKSARESLRTDIVKSLLLEVQGQIPVGYTTLDGLYTVTYQSDPETNDAAGISATLHEKATLSIALFPEKNLSSTFLSSATGASSTVRITNTDTLKGTIVGDATDIMSDSFTFKVSGSPHFVWTINTAALKESLHGKARSELQTILTKYPEITKADVTFRPLWRQKFPSDPNDISIVVNEDGAENH